MERLVPDRIEEVEEPDVVGAAFAQWRVPMQRL
jgi:hypothetical protein